MVWTTISPDTPSIAQSLPETRTNQFRAKSGKYNMIRPIHSLSFDHYQSWWSNFNRCHAPRIKFDCWSNYMGYLTPPLLAASSLHLFHSLSFSLSFFSFSRLTFFRSFNFKLRSMEIDLDKTGFKSRGQVELVFSLCFFIILCC